MLIYSQLHNASERAQVYKPWRGGASHVWRRWAPGTSALKMRDNQSSVRDCDVFFCGTVPRNVGRLASMQMRGLFFNFVFITLPSYAHIYKCSPFDCGPRPESLGRSPCMSVLFLFLFIASLIIHDGHYSGPAHIKS